MRPSTRCSHSRRSPHRRAAWRRSTVLRPHRQRRVVVDERDAVHLEGALRRVGLRRALAGGDGGDLLREARRRLRAPHALAEGRRRERLALDAHGVEDEEEQVALVRLPPDELPLEQGAVDEVRLRREHLHLVHAARAVDHQRDGGGRLARRPGAQGEHEAVAHAVRLEGDPVAPRGEPPAGARARGCTGCTPGGAAGAAPRAAPMERRTDQ